MACLESVNAFAARWDASKRPLHALINNAGIFTLAGCESLFPFRFKAATCDGRAPFGRLPVALPSCPLASRHRNSADHCCLTNKLRVFALPVLMFESIMR